MNMVWFLLQMFNSSSFLALPITNRYTNNTMSYNNQLLTQNNTNKRTIMENSKPNTSTFKPEPNTITLQTSDTSEPILVLKPNGDIYVNGRLTTNDMEVVEGLRRFLLQAEFNYFK